jgi:hypothetical protein
VPVPDGSRPAAIQMSAELGLPYREGLVKNRYVGRTFIMPDQRTRELSVRRKLNAMPAVFSGKSVLLVDDSIVRGTTMSQIVDMVRKAGAKKVWPCWVSDDVKCLVWCAKLMLTRNNHMHCLVARWWLVCVVSCVLLKMRVMSQLTLSTLCCCGQCNQCIQQTSRLLHA